MHPACAHGAGNLSGKEVGQQPPSGPASFAFPYAEYRRVREKMRELLVVKANVDRILGIEKDGASEKETPSELHQRGQ